MSASFLSVAPHTPVAPAALVAAVIASMAPPALTPRQQCALIAARKKSAATEKETIPLVTVAEAEADFARYRELKDQKTTIENEMGEINKRLKSQYEPKLIELGVGSIRCNGATTLVKYPKFKTIEEARGADLKARFNGRFQTLFTLVSNWEPTDLMKSAVVNDPHIGELAANMPELGWVTALTIK